MTILAKTPNLPIKSCTVTQNGDSQFSSDFHIYSSSHMPGVSVDWDSYAHAVKTTITNIDNFHVILSGNNATQSTYNIMYDHLTAAERRDKFYFANNLNEPNYLIGHYSYDIKMTIRAFTETKSIIYPLYQVTFALQCYLSINSTGVIADTSIITLESQIALLYNDIVPKERTDT